MFKQHMPFVILLFILFLKFIICFTGLILKDLPSLVLFSNE